MKNDIVRNLIEKLQALAAENGWTVIWSIERTPHGYVTFSFNNGKDGRERKRFLKQISYDILLESRVSVDMLAERIIKEVYEAFEKRTQDGFRTNVQIVDELVGLIKAERAFESNSKLINASSGILQTTNQMVN